MMIFRISHAFLRNQILLSSNRNKLSLLHFIHLKNRSYSNLRFHLVKKTPFSYQKCYLSRPFSSQTSVTSLSNPDPSIFIPEPPNLSSADLPIEPDSLSALNAWGEPTLSSLGLASWWPAGRLQLLLETLRDVTGLPWWLSIVLLSVSTRLILFPLIVRSRRNLVNMRSSSQSFRALNERMNAARLRGDLEEIMIISQSLEKYKDYSKDLKWTMVMPVVQILIFGTVYPALNGMCNLPVASMQTEGFAWFTDLTLADPYFVLPLMTSGTMALMILVGADFTLLTNKRTMQAITFGLPTLVFLMLHNMTSAINLFWTVGNSLSLLQTLALMRPRIRKFFKIPEPKPQSMDSPEPVKKGFMENFRETKKTQALLHALNTREVNDLEAWRKAGKQSIVKTYANKPKS